jgi:drug/metabolite transporter (DMT)-like permease
MFAVGFTAVFNTVIPFVLYQRGLKDLTASSSAVVLMLEIVVAILISVTFRGETFTVFAWTGALAVLASIFLVSGVEISGKSLSVRVTDASRVKDA